MIEWSDGVMNGVGGWGGWMGRERESERKERKKEEEEEIYIDIYWWNWYNDGNFIN